MLRQAVIDQCTQDLCDIRGFDRTELVHLEEGYAECRAYPGPDCVNDVGTVHGGFLLALADQAAAASAESLGTVTVTLNMSASFFRPGLTTDEYIQVTSRVLHAGRTTVVSEVEMANPNGKRIFKATFTQFLTDKKL
jgi:acyl-CoA thioesterase